MTCLHAFVRYLMARVHVFLKVIFSFERVTAHVDVMTSFGLPSAFGIRWIRLSQQTQ